MKHEGTLIHFRRSYSDWRGSCCVFNTSRYYFNHEKVCKILFNAVADSASGLEEGVKKHEIYGAAIGYHLFYD